MCNPLEGLNAIKKTRQSGGGGRWPQSDGWESLVPRGQVNRDLSEAGQCALQISIQVREGTWGISKSGRSEPTGWMGLLESPIPWFLDRLFVRPLIQKTWGSLSIDVTPDAAAQPGGHPCWSLCPQPGRWGQRGWLGLSSASAQVGKFRRPRALLTWRRGCELGVCYVIYGMLVLCRVASGVPFYPVGVMINTMTFM